MNNAIHPRAVSRQIVEQTVGAETLIYHEGRHEAFCLNPVSAAVWRLCDGQNSIAGIAERATLDLAHPVSCEIVEFALQELRGYGLLEAVPAEVPANAVSRRALLQKLGAAAALVSVTMIAAPAAAQANGYDGGGFSPDAAGSPGSGGSDPLADPFAPAPNEPRTPGSSGLNQ